MRSNSKADDVMSTSMSSYFSDVNSLANNKKHEGKDSQSKPTPKKSYWKIRNVENSNQQSKKTKNSEIESYPNTADDDDVMSTSSTLSFFADVLSFSNNKEIQRNESLCKPTPKKSHWKTAQSDLEDSNQQVTRHCSPNAASRRKTRATTLLESCDDVQKKKSTSFPSSGQIAILVLALIVTAVLAVLLADSHLVISNKKSNSFRIGSFKKALESKVLGQIDAITEVLTHLRNLKPDSGLQVILLVGGPGVGKDLMAQTVTTEFFRQYDNPCQGSSYLLLDHKGNICSAKRRLNIVSLESVRGEGDIDKAVNLVNRMEQDDVNGIVFLPILAMKAFNEEKISGLEVVATVDEYVQLIHNKGVFFQRLLANKGVESDIIFFNPLTREIVERCLGTFNNKAINSLMQGREFSLHGCKGLEYLM